MSECRGDLLFDSGRLPQSWGRCSHRQGPRERGILCRSGARTPAPQTPVVTCLGAGNLGTTLRNPGGRAVQDDRTSRVSGGRTATRTDR